MEDLEQIITDSVNDSLDTSSDSVDTVEVEASPEVSETPEVADVEAAPETDATTETTDNSVTPPANATDEPQDEFAKLAGMSQMGVAGRENRIPYSRVKKITEKAVSDLAEVAVGRKLNAGEKPLDVVKSYVAQIPELTSKVTDYEARLTNVGQFENVMANEPHKFLTMLARIPVYREFFEFVDKAYAAQAAGTPIGTAAPVTPAESVITTDPSDEMPEPDEELSDGSRVYGMDGLKKLLDWKGKQVEKNVISQFEQRYKPIEADWQERKRIEATLPVVRQQIADAKTWPLFTDNEDEIVKALQDDPKISLEGAYRKVVFPKLVAERNKTKQDVIREIQAAPTSTSIPARVATKPVAPSAGPRSIEDIIKDSVDSLKR